MTFGPSPKRRNTVRRSGWFAVVIVAVLGSRASAQVPSRAAMAFARRIAGCYELVPGPWRADSVRAGDISTVHVPMRFRLTDERLAGWDSLQSAETPMFAVIELPLTGRVTGLFSYWQRLAVTQDTIIIGYPVPLAGIRLLLSPADRDLSGSIHPFTDYGDDPPAVTMPVRARRIACPRAR